MTLARSWLRRQQPEAPSRIRSATMRYRIERPPPPACRVLSQAASRRDHRGYLATRRAVPAVDGAVGLAIVACSRSDTRGASVMRRRQPDGGRMLAWAVALLLAALAFYVSAARAGISSECARREDGLRAKINRSRANRRLPAVS